MPEEEYEAPSVSELGSLHDMTLSPGKVFSPNADFHYPNGNSFAFSH